MWVAPYYAQARMAMRRFSNDFRAIVKNVDLSHKEITLYADGGESLLSFRGSDNEDSLPGPTLDGAVLDECGIMKGSIWPEYIRPMLMVKKGWCDFIGTPKGGGWYKDLWVQAEEDPDWTRFHAPSNNSPFVDAEEFERIRKHTPDLIFRQEYLADFIDDGAGVFTNIRGCIKGLFSGPEFGANYVMGVDLARKHDWTVITVIDIYSQHVVHWERFNQIDWNTQERRIAAIAKRYNAPINIDATGVGDPIVERLINAGLAVNPVVFNNSIKTFMVQNLALLIEQGEISYPEEPTLLAELSVFSGEQNNGKWKYGAPSGYHDDAVMSLCLATKDMGSVSDGPMFGDVGI